ncbi:NAD(P)-dependent oxidoreductase [Aquabacter spiritensis]|uniref:2-hydroxy-3-oxopropionate reductase n=1 Tax=Aquabacter spiritensis TaxID=933073 RepID=A0A4R3LUP1_9HYPH|nr:NAD(P)-dependent oxidoreductase [Aquabacter spiritensis]TCT04234.1 2-hydroxy-3-oxopropionate reductase [Aquabacter spiritensis]
MTQPSIGFIGLGRMGAPMAGRLVEAGYDVTVCDTNAAAIAELVAKGAKAAASPKAVASAAEWVLASLPTPDVVKLVALGPNGVAEGTSVKVFVDLSTTGPRVEADVAAGLAQKGIEMVDCPVSGGVAGAKAGKLAMMAAGTPAVFEALKAVFAHLGRVTYVGEKPGQAQTMKLINNMVSVAALAITSEAMVLGTKAGLDADVMIEVLNAGSGRNSASADKIPNFVLPRTFDFGFAVGLAAKDSRLCLEEAEAMGVPMVVGSAVRQMLTITRELFGPEADMTSMIRTVENWAGVEVRGKAANKA